MVELAVLAVTMIGETLTATRSTDEQLFASVPVTMYTVVEDGEATGFAIVELLNDAAGDHT
jgi:hypothetical protein